MPHVDAHRRLIRTENDALRYCLCKCALGSYPPTVFGGTVHARLDRVPAREDVSLTVAFEPIEVRMT